MTDQLSSFYRAHPNAITAGTAAVIGIAAFVYRAGGVESAVERLKHLVRPATTSLGVRVPCKEERLLKHVYNRAAEGNPQSVLKVIDDFGHKIDFLMNVGDVKGALLRAEVAKKQPKVAVEFGCYIGYSAVLIAAAMPEGSKLYSIDIDPLHAAIATKIVEFAGLKDKVTILVGTVEDRLHTLQSKHGVTNIDLLFVDHHKSLYLPDLRRVEQMNLLSSGSVVVGDNIIYPGAPDYLEYVQNNPHYTTVLHPTTVEYSDTPDAVAVSIRK